MYLIVVYDVDVVRVSSVNKFLKRYLYWRQNSVFEGEVTKSQLEEIKAGLSDIIDGDVDSVLIYSLPDNNQLKRTVMGIDKSPIDNIL